MEESPHSLNVLPNQNHLNKYQTQTLKQTNRHNLVLQLNKLSSIYIYNTLTKVQKNDIRHYQEALCRKCGLLVSVVYGDVGSPCG